MSEAKASTQYNDFTGTVAIDGCDGPFLDAMLRAGHAMPRGYWPVGFKAGLMKTLKGDQLHVQLLCVDTDVTGKSGDEIGAYAKTVDQLPVLPFDCQITFPELLKLMKGAEIVVKSKLVGRAGLHVAEISRPIGLPEEDE